MSSRLISRSISIVRSARGETLVETLAAILVGSLATIMLANAIGAANRIVLRAQNVANDHYTAETNLATNRNDQLTVTVGQITVEGSAYGNQKSINSVPCRIDDVGGGFQAVSWGV